MYQAKGYREPECDTIKFSLACIEIYGVAMESVLL